LDVIVTPEGMGRVRREIGRHALAELGTQGFTALAAIRRDGPMRISDVAARLAVDLSVASRQVAALIDAGYLERAADPDDRRGRLVETTEAGAAVLKESHRRMVHAFAEVLEDWSTEDVVALSDALARLNADFEHRSGAQTEAVR
jgi:DNA-binding MarR family transcriptional regulator